MGKRIQVGQETLDSIEATISESISNWITDGWSLVSVTAQVEPPTGAVPPTKQRVVTRAEVVNNTGAVIDLAWSSSLSAVYRNFEQAVEEIETVMYIVWEEQR